MRPTPFRVLVVTVLAVASLGVAASDVFASGDLGACTLVAREGTDPDPTGTILEAVTTTGGDVVAVGSHVVGPISTPLAQRWDGTAWTTQELDRPPGAIGISSLYDVTAFAPDDVWAVGSWEGQHPLIEHYDGTSWSLVEAPDVGGEEQILTGIAGTGPDDLWIVGQHRVEDEEHAIVLHGGTKGFQIATPPDAAVLHGVAMLGDGLPIVAGWRIGMDGFAAAVISRWSGAAWIDEPTPEHEEANTFLFSIAVGAGGAAWAVGFGNTSPNGDAPFTLQRGPNGWREIDEPDLGPSTRIVSVATGGAGTVAVGVVSDGGSVRATAIRLDGGAWTPIAGAGSEPPDALNGVAVTDRDVWAVGKAVVVGATYGVPSARVYSCG